MLVATLGVAAAVATLVVVGVVVSRDDTTPADQPSPTVTVPPTTPPRALVEATKDPEQLAPGTYFLDGGRTVHDTSDLPHRGHWVVD